MQRIKKVSYNSKSFFSDLTQSLVETGFAIIADAPVNNEIIQLSYSEWEDFFADEEKYGYLFDPQTQYGYFPFGTENAKDQKQPDPKEFFHLYHGYGLPSNIPTHYTQILFELLEQLGSEVLAGIDAFYSNRQVLGLANMSYNSPNTLMRILHYPPLKTDKDSKELPVRAAAHEDINLITLLPVSTLPGLQVQDRDGNWYSVGGEPGDIVVNAGDMLSWLTKSHIKSTTHRVVTPAGCEAASRYSIALFIHAKPETVILDGKTASELLKERLKAIGIAK